MHQAGCFERFAHACEGGCTGMLLCACRSGWSAHLSGGVCACMWERVQHTVLLGAWNASTHLILSFPLILHAMYMCASSQLLKNTCILSSTHTLAPSHSIARIHSSFFSFSDSKLSQQASPAASPLSSPAASEAANASSNPASAAASESKPTERSTQNLAASGAGTTSAASQQATGKRTSVACVAE